MIDTLVPAHSRTWLVAAASSMVGALAVTGWTVGWLVLATALGFLFVVGRPLPLLIGALVVLPGLWETSASIPQGQVDVMVSLTSDVREGDFGPWALGTMFGVPVYLDLPSDTGALGDTLGVHGSATGKSVTFGGRPRQVIAVEDVDVVGSNRGIYQRVGSAVRRHVTEQLVARSEAHSLLAGFLVGDVSGLSTITVDAMRRTGLSHFVAVSGSNVALFLGFVVVAGLPFGIGPKRRALLGLLSLPVFVVATGLEPSVIRASAMAAVVLVGVLADMRLETWQVVAMALVLVLLFDPWLARSVGFQLSVAATAGVIVGSRWPTGGGPFPRSLAVTLGAQIAVAPLLLIHFGSIPLLSPLANLIAAPLVALATVLALVGVVGLPWFLAPASWVAAAVIEVAHLGASWPQVGWLGFLGSGLLIVGIFAMFRRRREFGALVVAGLVSLAILPGSGGLDPGQVAVLDVGQGDAIVLSGGDGRFALVDGGRDPTLLVQRLRELGISSIELAVMTHGDADHAGGLIGLTDRFGVGAIWERTAHHHTGSSEQFLAAAAASGIPISQPEVGSTWDLGALQIRLLGPERRFASGNDQSIVLLVSGSRSDILLTGDIERVGQLELGDVHADILKVPHHGAGTTDQGWLERAGPQIAVISVGPNDFGHPVPWVVETLVGTGAQVRRTDQEGNIVFDLGS